MAKRKTSKKQDTSAASGITTVGLDIGYGVVKVATDDTALGFPSAARATRPLPRSRVATDDTALGFPSVMGHAREIKFQQDTIQQKYPGDQITDTEGKWFVGDLAMAQVPAGELLRLRGRTANEKTMGNAFRLRLAKVAVGKLVQGVWGRDAIHLRLAVGLPVDV